MWCPYSGMTMNRSRTDCQLRSPCASPVLHKSLQCRVFSSRCVPCMCLWRCPVPAPLSPHSMRPIRNPSEQLQQLRVSLGNARSAFVAASNKAPPVIKRTPWFKALEESVLPQLQPKPEADAAAGDSSCPETCLNLRLVSSECRVLHGVWCAVGRL